MIFGSRNFGGWVRSSGWLFALLLSQQSCTDSQAPEAVAASDSTPALAASVAALAPSGSMMKLALTPGSSSIHVGSGRQFSVLATWSNGATSVPAVKYSASGGAISTGGYYEAGSAAGKFRVVALQQGGSKADTSYITVTSLVKLNLTPATAAVKTGATVQFSANGTRSDGSVEPQPVTWKVSAGSVSSTGQFTAGSSAGTVKVIAINKGGTMADTSTVTVSAQATSGDYAHQPSGYTRFAENNFSVLPAAGHGSTLTGANAGLWGNTSGSEQAYYAGNSSIAADAAAPQSPVGVFSTRFPAGLKGGIAPVQMYGWESSAARKKKVYLSIWIKLVGANFECNPVNTKLGFMAYGIDPAQGGQNEGYFRIMGNGTQTPTSSFNIRFTQQGHVDRDLLQNMSTGKVMTSGVWHHWEIVMELNTLGQANGIFKWWVDGVQTHNYTDVVYIKGGNTTPFNLWKWNPTWGGGDAPVKQRNDYVQIDHVYLSGT